MHSTEKVMFEQAKNVAYVRNSIISTTKIEAKRTARKVTHTIQKDNHQTKQN